MLPSSGAMVLTASGPSGERPDFWRTWAVSSWVRWPPSGRTCGQHPPPPRGPSRHLVDQFVQRGAVMVAARIAFVGITIARSAPPVPRFRARSPAIPVIPLLAKPVRAVHRTVNRALDALKHGGKSSDVQLGAADVRADEFRLVGALGPAPVPAPGWSCGWQGGTLTRMDEFERYLAALAESTAPRRSSTCRAASRPSRTGGQAGPAGTPPRAAGPLQPGRSGPAWWSGSTAGARRGAGRYHHAPRRRRRWKAGVDGLMVTCSGAGGHTGFLTPFAFVPAVRDLRRPADRRGRDRRRGGHGGRAGAGRRHRLHGHAFHRHAQRRGSRHHRAMIERAGLDRIVVSSAMNGVPANWIRDSLEEAGLGDDEIRGPKISPCPKACAACTTSTARGRAFALIEQVEPVADLAARLTREFERAAPWSNWRERLAEIDRKWRA